VATAVDMTEVDEFIGMGSQVEGEDQVDFEEESQPQPSEPPTEEPLQVRPR
jgi:hypothetical protein